MASKGVREGAPLFSAGEGLRFPLVVLGTMLNPFTYPSDHRHHILHFDSQTDLDLDANIKSMYMCVCILKYGCNVIDV